MKKLMICLVTFFACQGATLEAVTTTTYTYDNSNIQIYFDHPEDLKELNNAILDQLFQHPQNKDRLSGFHFIHDATFNLTNMMDVIDYGDWLKEALYEGLPQTDVKILTAADYGSYSFVLTSKEQEKIYCFIYVVPIGNDIYFAIINTSTVSKQEAVDDAIKFIKNISWNVPSH